MRPWQHARSSAGKHRDWMIDLPIHEFIDSTKMACTDLKHRMILHNSDLGPDLARRVFPDRSDVSDVILRHLDEDLGCRPTLAQWLSVCDITRWPRPLYRRRHISFDDVVTRVTNAQGLKDTEHVKAVLDVLVLPVQYAGMEALPILFNGFGPVLVGTILGGPRYVCGKHSERCMFDPVHAAEAIIYRLYGTIPSLAAIVEAVCPRRSDVKEALQCKLIGA